MEKKEVNLRNMTAVYIRSQGKILMLYRIGSKVVEPSWVGVGGHFEKEELNDPRACVLRELYEETGLSEKDLCGMKLRYVTLRMKKGEIRQNYYYFAELAASSDTRLSSSEGRLAWVPEEEVLKLPMPLTAKQMLTHYMETGRLDQQLYCGVTCREAMVFTPLKEF